MKVAFIILLMAWTAADDRIRADSGAEDRLGMLRAEFLGWMDLHQKVYQSPQEFERRFRIYQENLRTIEAHNRLNSSYSKGVDKFADMTNEEYEAMFVPRLDTSSWGAFYQSLLIKVARYFPSISMASQQPQTGLRGTGRSYDELSTKRIDWEELGALNPIRDQMVCGSCYSFATVAAVEAAYFIKHGKKIELSEQHMIDCIRSSGFHANGCSGSLPGAAQGYIAKHGLQLASDYPYSGEARKCVRDKEPAVRIQSIKEGMRNNIELLEELIKGPLAATIDWNSDFRFYVSGVFDLKYPCGHRVNHLISIVGFDLTADVPYIKLRNSHGMRTGTDGYIKVALGGPEDMAFCGLSFEVFRPILAD